MTGKLHPLIAEAAEGRLPEWSEVREARQVHMAAVADLLGRWALELGLSERDGRRWRAAGWLHDSLRDADPEGLGPEVAAFPPRLRHGPAAAARLAAAGVEDDELLEAVGHHTLGRRGLGRLGRFLYLADYLEPGRTFAAVENAALRARLPGEAPAVLRKVAARRIAQLLERGRPIHAETMGFWNELQGGG